MVDVKKEVLKPVGDKLPCRLGLISYMKKRKMGRKLSRGQGARKALFRALIKALVAHGSIKTTKAKVKAVQSDIDKLVHLAKKDTVAKRRQVMARLGNDRETTEGLFKSIAPRFIDRKSGFTRLVNLPRRKGDNAEIARIEWTKEIATSDKQKVKSDKKIKDAKGKVISKNKIDRKESRGKRVATNRSLKSALKVLKKRSTTQSDKSKKK